MWTGKNDIRIRYVWTRILWKTEIKISVFKNVRILVDKASFYVRVQVFQKPQLSIRFNLLQFCPSMPSFIYAVFLILSFNVLSGYFMFRKKLTTDPPVWISINSVTNRNTKQHQSINLLINVLWLNVVSSCYDGVIINQRNASWFHKVSNYQKKPTSCKHVPSIHNDHKSYSALGLSQQRIKLSFVVVEIKKSTCPKLKFTKQIIVTWLNTFAAHLTVNILSSVLQKHDIHKTNR